MVFFLWMWELSEGILRPTGQLWTSYEESSPKCGTHTLYYMWGVTATTTTTTFFHRAQKPLIGQGLLIIKASRSHSDTPHSVGLLWMSDKAEAQTSTWQHTTLTRDRHICPRRDSNAPVPVTERPRNHVFDCAATGIGHYYYRCYYYCYYYM